MSEAHQDLLSLAAHEIKSPIASLKLFTQLYIQRAKNNGSSYTLKLTELQFIDSILTRLSVLTNNLLYKSPDKRKYGLHYTLKLEEIQLGEAVAGAVKEVGMIAGKHKIILDDKFGGKVFADKVTITQAVINILSNAVKFSPDGSTISVTCLEQKGFCVVSIKDRGIGIAKQKQKFIFDKFFTVNTRERNSLGLGLYFVREIIRLHKGRVWLTSRVGKGTTFFFALPLKN